MSDKQVYKLFDSTKLRSKIAEAVWIAPSEYVVTIQPPSRSLDQNARFHALCSEVSRQARFMGRTLTPAQWKVLFISGHAIATGLGSDMVPGIEGEYVNIRESSARMSVKRMASLIEYVQAWCVDNDIRILADKRYWETA